MKFRKKPVEVEARQVPAPSNDDTHNHFPACDLATWANGTCDGEAVYIQTLEGTMRGNVGDWIICGVKGEFYPCKPDIFEATYEPV
jgi:hypothetical protein